MAAITAMGGVGAGLSQAQFQMEYQVRALKEQQSVLNTLGTAALDLIRNATSVTVIGTQRNDLDVKA